MLHAGAVRCAERPGRAARCRQEAGADRGARCRGGFGAKLLVYPEFAVVAAAAKAFGRPVRWAETRSESMLNLNHGRAQVQRVEIGAKRDGTVVGMRVESWRHRRIPDRSVAAVLDSEMPPGVYVTPRIESRGWTWSRTPRRSSRTAARDVPRRRAAWSGRSTCSQPRSGWTPSTSAAATCSRRSTYPSPPRRHHIRHGDYEEALDERWPPPTTTSSEPSSRSAVTPATPPTRHRRVGVCRSDGGRPGRNTPTSKCIPTAAPPSTPACHRTARDTRRRRDDRVRTPSASRWTRGHRGDTDNCRARG